MGECVVGTGALLGRLVEGLVEGLFVAVLPVHKQIIGYSSLQVLVAKDCQDPCAIVVAFPMTPSTPTELDVQDEHASAEDEPKRPAPVQKLLCTTPADESEFNNASLMRSPYVRAISVPVGPIIGKLNTMKSENVCGPYVPLKAR